MNQRQCWLARHDRFIGNYRDGRILSSFRQSLGSSGHRQRRTGGRAALAARNAACIVEHHGTIAVANSPRFRLSL